MAREKAGGKTGTDRTHKTLDKTQDNKRTKIVIIIIIIIIIIIQNKSKKSDRNAMT